MAGGLSLSPRRAVAPPEREGVYLRCEGCGSLLRFLLRAKDGRDLCKRCLDGHDKRG
jgi:hypothetical protein